MNRRRELSKKYKEAGPRMGVYVVRNGADQILVIGASLDVDAAMNRCRFELRNGTHRDKRLLGEWLRAGNGGLQFEVVDTLKKRDEAVFGRHAELATLLALWREELVGDGRIVDPSGNALTEARQ